jgi:class I fructose-bisphosphate aldolase
MMNLHEITRDDKLMILAYDQGFEHGPVDFNLKNADPSYIFDIAYHGKFTAIATQPGIAEKHWQGKYQDVPLLVKLNAKTRLNTGDPVSHQHTSVQRAHEIGASAVGYTIYLGSDHEQEMLKEFGGIVEEAHRLGLTTVCWMYPRGQSIDDPSSTENVAYGVRVAYELGADIIKVKDNGDEKGMEWVRKNAPKAKLVVAGGAKKSDAEFLDNVARATRFGADGLAVGRNIWQNPHPMKMSAAVRKIIFEDEDVEHLKSLMS